MKQKITDTQLGIAIKKTITDYGKDKISLQKICDVVMELYEVKISRQGVQERIRKSVTLHDIYYDVRNNAQDKPILIRDSQKMFRGCLLPPDMDMLTTGTIKKDRIRDKVVYGHVPMEMLHLPRHIIIGDNGKLYMLNVTRYLQHDD